MSDNRDAVAHVAMYALLGKALKDQENQGRSYLVDSMEVGEAVVGRANGLPVGRAVKSVRTDAKVVDDKALLKWVKANHPDEVETVEQVRPAFLAQLKKAGELSDGGTPLIVLVEGNPYVTVKPTEHTEQVIRELLAHGKFSLEGPAALDAAVIDMEVEQ